jgi:putative nucleic acid modification protein with dual OB domain
MLYTKTIVCLANSRKHLGRCVAGKEYSKNGFGGWIRPVSDRATEEISWEDQRFQNNLYAQLLDVICIPMLEHRPKDYQTENHLIDRAYYWTKEGELNWKKVIGAVDSIQGPLWLNKSSSYYGVNDRVDVADAVKLSTSLLLIRPDDLAIQVAIEGAEFNNPQKKVRARFRFNNLSYLLSVTDPDVEQKYLQQDNGSYGIRESLLCVSLGEPYKDYAYKLIAAVITPN